ncbi:MAG: hypothetical protein JXR22_08465 [Prolixibacteraceae bacterium]|nr:hypothetical protein [Prolixibacteraceae bacterium]
MPMIKPGFWQFFIHRLPTTLLLFSAIILIAACSKTLPRKDAEKQLKAFDNELITLFDQLSESEGLRLLNHLLSVNNLPLPLLNFVESNPATASAYHFSEHAGIYRVDTLTMQAIKIASSDAVLVYFPYLSRNDSMAYLRLTNYQSKMTKWGTEVPTSMNMKLGISDRVLFSLDLKGEVKHNIPTKMNVEMKLAQYNLKLRLRSLLNKQTARFYLRVDLKNSVHDILRSKVYMQHDVSNPAGSMLENTKVSLKSFPVSIRVLIDNGAINPASTNFMEEFNQYTRIRVASQLSGASLGEVDLMEREGQAKLHYALSFSDSSSVFLEDLMLSYKYLMNLRYPDVPVSRR